MTNNVFTENLLGWFQVHGRHHLPWQINPTPYRVWVSEIMLQQTQVSTVNKYYQSFIKQFSSIKSLSEAQLDDVLKLWSGLGYYARARNLHRCAQIVCEQYGGEFPKTIEQLTKLPGIGRSTAGAILSFSMQTRAPILDGNVKRVLTRYSAVAGAVTDKAVISLLWDMAEQYTPLDDHAHYNQAIMDLGATICTRHHPQCPQCPVRSSCQSYSNATTHEFPQTVKKKKARVQKSIQMLIIQNADGKIWLEKRPPTGIWGGLWSFPQCDITDADISEWRRRHLPADVVSQENWTPFKHIFTHFDLTIHPVLLTINHQSFQIMEAETHFWYNIADPLPGGIAAPMAKLLKQLKGRL
jgi:A/G-specific adenine glycosylase